MQVVRRSSGWVVEVSGELDRMVAADLVGDVARALGAEVADVVIDLSHAEYLDGGGLHAIDTCRTQCQAAGVQLSLADEMPPNVRRILALVGMDGLARPVVCVDDE